jgi:hypothetical protein
MVVEVGMVPKVTGGKVIRIEELHKVYSSFIYNLTTETGKWIYSQYFYYQLS